MGRQKVQPTMTGFLERLKGQIISYAKTLLNVMIALVVIVIGELIGPLRTLDAYLTSHQTLRDTLQVITMGGAIMGILLLALSQFLPAPRLPEGKTQQEIEQASPKMKWREDPASVRSRIRGGFSGEASFSAVKSAFKLSSWRYDHRWRVVFSMMLGAILLFFGLFGFFFVIGSPGIKFLMGLLMLYAITRTVWGFSQA